MNSVMRVAHLVSHPIQYFVPLYRELARRPDIDHTVYFYSDATLRRFHDDEFGREIQWDTPLLDGYESRFCSSALNKGILGDFIQPPNWDIIRETAFGKYDVIWVHGYTHPNTWLAAVAASISGTKLLIREDQTLLNVRPWHKRLLKAFMLRILFRYVCGLYVGENNRKYFEHYGMPGSRLFPARHCVDNDYFRTKAKEIGSKKREARAGFGIIDDTPVILFCGKFISQKNLLLLIEAFAQVRGETPCWLLMVGEGHLRQPMENLIRHLQIPNVLMPGFLNQSELPSAYISADVFVLPSCSETWGLVVNEAMNFSLPVVVTNKVGCAADLVCDGVNGNIVDHDCVDTLVEAMGRLVKDRELRENFGRRSYEIVSNYTIKACADNIVAACLAVSQKDTSAQESHRV